jgi:hypothetical protein
MSATTQNIVTLEYFDEKNKYGNIFVNGERIGVGKSHFRKYKGFNPIYEYTAILVNNWNMSAPIQFHAKTLKSLMAKIRKHQYRLAGK